MQARSVPEREEELHALVSVLGRAVGPRFRALDLGSGTGSTAERILSRCPGATVVAVDFDPVTRRIGETALASWGGRLAWVDADLRRADWVQRLPTGRFDAAVSTTALHWLDGRALSRLYRDIAHRLRPGGIFLNGDSMAYGPDAQRLRRWARQSSKEWYRDRRGPRESWTEWWRAALADPALATEAALRADRFPTPSTARHGLVRTPDLSGHVRRARAAGFREVEVVWSRWQSRILAAVR